MKRRLILYMSQSFDGYASRADGTMDWLGDEQPFASFRQRAVAELLGRTELLLLGRRAAQDMAQAWPGSTSPTGRSMNSLPKLVFSRSTDRLDWQNTRVSTRPAEEEVSELKDQPGGDLVVFGGATFARSLAGHGLIDEYRINVQPVALGAGRPLLHGLRAPVPLTLVSSTAWADGPVTHIYVPREET